MHIYLIPARTAAPPDTSPSLSSSRRLNFWFLSNMLTSQESVFEGWAKLRAASSLRRAIVVENTRERAFRMQGGFSPYKSRIAMGASPPLGGTSRIDIFNAQFQQQMASCIAQTVGTPACGVPRFNYLIAMNDHTNGMRTGDLSPQAMVADNDLMLGQLLQILSNSAIWPRIGILNAFFHQERVLPGS